MTGLEAGMLAGLGPEMEPLRRAAQELGLEDHVHFLGFVPDAELPGVYRNCDIFISANRELEGGDFEGFGIVFLEASASGKPVIGGASGGTAGAAPGTPVAGGGTSGNGR